MFSFLNLILRINSNHALRPHRIRMAFKPPKNWAKYEEVFGLRPEFDAETNEMIFRKSALLIPMKAFNPETFNLLNQYLQNRLHQMSHAENMSDKVKRVLHQSFHYEFPDIDTVADKLNLSARTLQRKLSDEQTTFKDLLQETRFGIAKQLLKQSQLSVSEISYMLGYSDLGNFSRSFKKYIGQSPQQFKEQE